MKKILGLGNALVDTIIFLRDDEILKRFSFPRGSMQLVDSHISMELEQATSDLEKYHASGGSAANTIHGLARLGVTAGFIGTVGLDAMGDFFRNDMLQAGIQPLLETSKSATGRSQALVSPDGERTMATYLGAAVELSGDKLDAEVFSRFDHLHLEGYLVLNRELVNTALNYARQLNMTVSLDLASFNVVEANLGYLRTLVEEYVDIVFANEDEARAFTGETDARSALADIAGLCSIAVVKIGEKGSLVHSEHSTSEVKPIPVNCIDTTGAGDLYAAGFLYGYASGRTIADSGRIGSLLAGKVIEEAGAKISIAGWETILQSL